MCNTYNNVDFLLVSCCVALCTVMFTPSPSLPPSLPPSLTPSVPLSLSPSLHPYLPPSLPPSPTVPSFVVRFNNVRIHSSKVYENLRKTDPVVELTLPQPVPLCGDIKIEFFHSTRGWKKVGAVFICVCVCVYYVSVCSVF